MATSPTSLRVRISADLADIRQGLGLLRGELAKVKRDAAQTTPDTTQWAQGIGRVRSELANLAGAYLGLQGLTQGVQALFGAFDRADRIGEAARISGIGTEALSRLAFAAQFSGVHLDALQTSFTIFNKELVKNAGLVQAVGVEVYEAGTTNFRPTEQILLDLADVFASLPDGPERAALAVKLFGRSGADLIPVLIEGRQRLEAFGDQADATGNTISEDAAAAAGKFTDNLDILKATLTGVANETAARLIPAISGYAEEAVQAGQGSNVAAEGGQLLANVLKVVAAGAVIVKNVVEAATTTLVFLGDVAVRVATAVSGSLGKALGAVAGAGRAIAGGASPLAVFSSLRQSLKDTAASAKGELAGIGHGYAALKSGLSEAASDISKVASIFDSASGKAVAGAQGIATATGGIAPASEAALAAVRKLLGGDQPQGKTAQNIAKSIAESNALLRDSISRALKEIDRLYEANEMGITEYFARRKALQEGAIDADIEQARAELAVTSELGARRKIEEDIIKLQRDRADVGTAGAREQKKAEEELAKVVGDVYIKQLERTGNVAAARRAQLEEEYLPAIKKLQAEDRADDIVRIRVLIDSEVAKAQLEQLKSQGDEIAAALQGSETSLSAQASAGLMGGLEAERQIEAARAKALQQYQALRQAALAYYNAQAPGTPEHAAALAGLQAIETRIADVVASQNVFRQQIEDLAVSSVSSAFSDLATGAQNFKDSFKQMVRSFVQGVAQMIAQALALRAVKATLGLFGGGAGASFAAAHGGGTVGALSMIRHHINPLVFGTAPRYHEGGQAGLTGLKNNEVAAILQEGETIRTKSQEAALARRMEAGQGQVTVPTPIVVFGEDQLADALAGKAGERMIVHHVRNNRRAIDE